MAVREKFPTRIVLPLTDEQLRSIEDWRFENRVSARVEAIRRLIELGLKASKSRHDPAKEPAP